MKIGFPLVDEKTSTIAQGFHGSERISVVDLMTLEKEEFLLSDLERKSGNDNLFSILADLHVSTVICKKMQPMALKFFSNHNILVYEAMSDNIETNMDMLKQGGLNRFTADMAETSGCGSTCSSSSCSSCSS